MGTNYFHRSNICECCGRYDEQHICKSLVTFEAPVVWQDEPPYGYVVTVKSWADWKARLLDDGEVWDEYGERIPSDEFIARVEATDPERRRRQYDWMVEHEPERATVQPAEGMDWLDVDGFSFCGGAFS